VKSATCIVNGRVRNPSRRLQQLCRDLSDRGIDTRVVITQSAEHARSITRQSVQNGDDIVIAVGGDGTVHSVLQEVVQSSTSLAILPLGTGNDIARALGVRGDVSEITETPVRVDVARIEETGIWFLSVLATGFDAQVNARANSLGFGRYIRAFLLEFAHVQAHRYELLIDGNVTAGDAIMVCLGNTSTYGGGMVICPSARVQDGVFAITWISPVSRLRLLRFFPKVFRGRHVTLPEVRLFEGERVEIRGSQRSVFADGEPVGEIPLTASIVPGALSLHVRPGLGYEAS
jgi:diacylglycerol kinase (ATP)